MESEGAVNFGQARRSFDGKIWKTARVVLGAADCVRRDPRSSFRAVGQIPSAFDGRKDRIKGGMMVVSQCRCRCRPLRSSPVVSRRKDALCPGRGWRWILVDSNCSVVRGGVAVDPSTEVREVAAHCRRDSLEWSRPVVPEWKAKVGPSLFRFPSVTAAVSLLALQTPTT